MILDSLVGVRWIFYAFLFFGIIGFFYYAFRLVAWFYRRKKVLP